MFLALCKEAIKVSARRLSCLLLGLIVLCLCLCLVLALRLLVRDGRTAEEAAARGSIGRPLRLGCCRAKQRWFVLLGSRCGTAEETTSRRSTSSRLGRRRAAAEERGTLLRLRGGSGWLPKETSCLALVLVLLLLPAKEATAGRRLLRLLLGVAGVQATEEARFGRCLLCLLLLSAKQTACTGTSACGSRSLAFA